MGVIGVYKGRGRVLARKWIVGECRGIMEGFRVRESIGEFGDLVRRRERLY